MKVVVGDGETLLEPLLEDKKVKSQEFRRRTSPFNFKTVHPADIDALSSSGWIVQRAGKRKTRLKKEKPLDQRLEDRIWCLLFNMGYSRINGSQFNIRFQRSDGSMGRKQIDAFACDDETAFVVECKSKLERGRRSLQKDIHESTLLQDYIRKSVFQLYEGRPKPKIIWLYATQNIIWSESDVDRANDGHIRIITENELQYFEAFIRHMGPAGRFQVLGEFLQGQKVPALAGTTLPAIRGRIGGETFYSFVVTPRTLLRIAFINHQALNHPDGRPAYQRMISATRIKEISTFIRQGGYFPTNIIVNFTERPKFNLISNKENTDANIKFGWISLPTKYRSAWIVDGQHRLYGYSRFDDKLLDQSLFVLAFERMDTRKEADLFITINHKQKSVPKSLLVSLLADLRLGDTDPKVALSALASAIVRAINTDMTSPLTRRFAIHGVPPEENQNLTVSEVVNGLVRSSLVGKVVNRTIVAGPMSGATDEETINRSRTILNSYFEKVRATSPQRWEAGRSAYISTNPGVRAHLMLIAEIVSFLRHKKGVDFDLITESQFSDYVLEIAKPAIDFLGAASELTIKDKFSRKFGEGGVREYLFSLYEIINQEYADFGSEEFRRWVSQKASDKIDDANSFIMHLSEAMTNCVIEILKRVHGTHHLASGDAAFWEVGIESRRVKDKAYGKQQEDRQDRRKPKEAYFDVVDLIEIIKQSNNWSHFEHIFNLPKPGEKKGAKKYYLDWMNEYNELRKIAAHKNALRTYSDDDLEFLDWLRAEMAPRLAAEFPAHD